MACGYFTDQNVYTNEERDKFNAFWFEAFISYCYSRTFTITLFFYIFINVYIFRFLGVAFSFINQFPACIMRQLLKIMCQKKNLSTMASIHVLWLIIYALKILFVIRCWIYCICPPFISNCNSKLPSNTNIYIYIKHQILLLCVLSHIT